MQHQLDCQQLPDGYISTRSASGCQQPSEVQQLQPHSTESSTSAAVYIWLPNSSSSAATAGKNLATACHRHCMTDMYTASTQCQRVQQHEKLPSCQPCSSCTLNFSIMAVSKGIHKMCWQRSSTVVSNQQPDKSALPCSRLATCLQEASLCVAGSSCALSHCLCLCTAVTARCHVGTAEGWQAPPYKLK